MENGFVVQPLALRMQKLGYKPKDYLAFWNGRFLDFDIWSTEFYPVGKMRRDIGECTIAPTWQSAFEWFRDKYGLHIQMTTINHPNEYYARILQHGKDMPIYLMDTYEQVQQQGLEKLIEIVQQNKK